MTIRYYIHGDQIEGQQGQYYCAYCDYFVEKNHFEDTKHSGTDIDRYDRSVKRWKVLSKSHPKRLPRPDNAPNLFLHLPRPPKPKRSQFYRWLVKQQDRDDPIGDLSLDIQGNPEFPSNSNSLNILKNHLFRKLACSEAIQALEEAHTEFKNKKNVRSGISLKLRFEVFRKDDYRCQICGISASDGARLEADHKTPVAKGGTDEMFNLWTLCFECNREKGTKSL